MRLEGFTLEQVLLLWMMTGGPHLHKISLLTLSGALVGGVGLGTLSHCASDRGSVSWEQKVCEW